MAGIWGTQVVVQLVPWNLLPVLHAVLPHRLLNLRRIVQIAPQLLLNIPAWLYYTFLLSRVRCQQHQFLFVVQS